MKPFKFFKENSYDVIKVLINQIGITIFSFVLYFSVSSFKDSDLALYHKIMIVISVFAMLFFFALLYTSAWDLGANDKIRVDAGKMQKRMYKGACITLWANSINLLFAGITLITVAFGFEGVMQTISAVCYSIYFFMNAMYNGAVRNSIMLATGTTVPDPLVCAILFFVAPLLPVIASHIGYVFGMKNIKIFRTAPKKKAHK